MMQKMSNIFMGVHKYILITAKSTFDLKRGYNIFFFSTYLLKTTFYQNMWDYGLFVSFGGKVYYH